MLSVNFRGSTGFGKAFVTAADKEWGGRMHDDLIDAVEWAVARGIADPKRVCAYGASYGGYAALVAATKTPEVFACIVDIFGISNLLTFMATIPPYWKPWFSVWKNRLGDPDTEEGRAFLRSRSPLFHLERATRPILIVQGMQDVRVVAAESEQMVAALERKGAPVTYVSFPGRGPWLRPGRESPRVLRDRRGIPRQAPRRALPADRGRFRRLLAQGAHRREPRPGSCRKAEDMNTQAEKAKRFRALHESSFVIANAWDAGSARVLAGLGFQALATSSGAHAGTLGRRDGQVTREEALEHARAIVEATDLPVSADLEKCFADEPAAAAETIRLAAGVGLAGCSIEDATRDKVYDFAHAVERVAAAAKVARSHDLVLTARTENFVRGRPDLDDTIKRLQAFEKAGADVLMAPGLPDLESVRKVCAALSKPFNFMAGIKGKSFSVAELEAAGVRRVSLATSLWRSAMSGLVEAAREVKEKGTFGYIERSIATPDLSKFMRN